MILPVDFKFWKQPTAVPNPTQAVLNRKMSKKTGRKYAERQKASEVDKPLLDQFQTGEWKTFPGKCKFFSGRVLAAISSRPGQCGRSDGYILEVSSCNQVLHSYHPFPLVHTFKHDEARSGKSILFQGKELEFYLRKIKSKKGK